MNKTHFSSRTGVLLRLVRGSKRFFVASILFAWMTSLLDLINPKIIEADGKQTGEEGCLSLPGLQGTVTRPNHVICEAYDEDMQLRQIEGEGLLARAICHELDHLDGILYKDKVEDGLYKVEPVEPEE